MTANTAPPIAPSRSTAKINCVTVTPTVPATASRVFGTRSIYVPPILWEHIVPGTHVHPLPLIRSKRTPSITNSYRIRNARSPPETEALRSCRRDDVAARYLIPLPHLPGQLLSDPAHYVGSIIADAREQGRAARPLPTPTYEIQTRNRRYAAPVDEPAMAILNLGDRHPPALVLVPGRPDHGIHLGRLAAGEAEPLPIHLRQTPDHPDALLAQPPEPEILARKRIGAHQIPAHPRLARGTQDAELIHPPEDAPAQYTLGAHASGPARGEQDLVRGCQLHGYLPAGRPVPHDQYPT